MRRGKIVNAGRVRDDRAKRETSRSRRIGVLVSGGVESAALLDAELKRGRVVFPVYVRGGHEWEEAELRRLRGLLRAMRRPGLRTLSVLNLPVRDCYRRGHWGLSGRRIPSSRTPDEAVYLPGRNVLLLAKMGVFCAERRIGRIALGSLGCNPFPDGNRSFFDLMARAVSVGLGTPLRIEAPFARLHKADVLMRSKGIPWNLTFSCIAPKGLRHCGRCNKCAERRKAFRSAGVADPTEYLAGPRSLTTDGRTSIRGCYAILGLPVFLRRGPVGLRARRHEGAAPSRGGLFELPPHRGPAVHRSARARPAHRRGG